MRVSLLAAGLVTLAACSRSRPACVPTGCAVVACGGVDLCGNACGPGSGCVPTHAVQGAPVLGAGTAAALGGHAVERGSVTPGASSAAVAGGHSIAHGSISP